jgi:hypothetical protein
MQGAFHIAGAVAVGGVFGTEAADLVQEMAVGAVPGSKDGIVVHPKQVLAEMVGWPARRPALQMNQQNAGQFGEHCEHQEIDQQQPQDGSYFCPARWRGNCTCVGSQFLAALAAPSRR